MAKRGWGAITIDILEATLQPQGKMRIMYRANLNFVRFNKHFYALLDKGYMVKIAGPGGRSLYRISDRGKTFLEALKKVQDLGAPVDY